MIARRLERALKDAGIPVVGVSIGNISDRSTWVVYYGVGATAQQRTSGETIRQTFDPTAAVEDAKDSQEGREREIARKIIRALAIATHKRFLRVVTTDTTTAPEWTEAIRTEYDALS